MVLKSKNILMYQLHATAYIFYYNIVGHYINRNISTI